MLVKRREKTELISVKIDIKVGLNLNPKIIKIQNYTKLTSFFLAYNKLHQIFVKYFCKKKINQDSLFLLWLHQQTMLYLHLVTQQHKANQGLPGPLHLNQQILKSKHDASLPISKATISPQNNSSKYITSFKVFKHCSSIHYKGKNPVPLTVLALRGIQLPNGRRL